MRSKKQEKVLSALKEARETFEPGHMRDIMDESIGHLEAGHSYSEKMCFKGILRHRGKRIRVPQDKNTA